MGYNKLIITWSINHTTFLKTYFYVASGMGKIFNLCIQVTVWKIIMYLLVRETESEYFLLNMFLSIPNKY